MAFTYNIAAFEKEMIRLWQYHKEEPRKREKD